MAAARMVCGLFVLLRIRCAMTAILYFLGRLHQIYARQHGSCAALKRQHGNQ